VAQLTMSPTLHPTWLDDSILWGGIITLLRSIQSTGAENSSRKRETFIEPHSNVHTYIYIYYIAPLSSDRSRNDKTHHSSGKTVRERFVFDTRVAVGRRGVFCSRGDGWGWVGGLWSAESTTMWKTMSAKDNL